MAATTSEPATNNTTADSTSRPIDTRRGRSSRAVIPSNCSRVAKSRYASITRSRAAGSATASRRATTSASPNDTSTCPVAALRSSWAAARSISRSSRLAKCGDTCSSASVIRAGQRFGVGPVGLAVGAEPGAGELGHLDRFAEHDDGPAAGLDPALERHPDRHDHDVGRGRQRPECDPRGARLHPIEPGAIAGGALREDRHGRPLCELAMAGVEHGGVVARTVAVGGAVHGEHAGEPQERAGDDHLPQRCLGEEAREPAEDAGHDDRVDEAVAVVGHDQHWAIAREPLAPAHLDRSMERQHEAAGDQTDGAVGEPSEQPRGPIGIGGAVRTVDPRQRDDRRQDVPEAVRLQPRLGVARPRVGRPEAPHRHGDRTEREQRPRPDPGHRAAARQQRGDDDDDDGDGHGAVRGIRCERPQQRRRHEPDGEPDQRTRVGPITRRPTCHPATKRARRSAERRAGTG